MSRPSPSPAPQFAALFIAALATVPVGGCGAVHTLRNMGKELGNPYETVHLTDEEKVRLIDSMRGQGSYEGARKRLNNTARIIADRIAAAVPGQTWAVDNDAAGLEIDRAGSSCDTLTGDLALRPSSDVIVFGGTFSDPGFSTAVAIVREEAAKYGAADASSLPNPPGNRDLRVQGNGYGFELGQVKVAALSITGPCFLRQSTIDSPPGQLPRR